MSDEETKLETPVAGPRGFWERLAQIGVLRLAAGVVLLAAVVDLSIDYFTDVTRRVKPSVVAVVCFDKSGRRLAEGSGFFVDSRHVITNRHLILGASKAEISMGRSRWRVQGVAAENQTADLVSLAVSHVGRPLDLPRSRLLRNEPVIVVGRSRAWGIRIAQGRLTSVRTVHGFGPVALTSAAVRLDCTGSPVVNDRGMVIGVAVSRVVDGRRLRFVVSAERARSLKPGRVSALEVYGSRNAVEWPGTSRGLRSKGLLFVITRDYKRALPYFEKALQKEPNDYTALHRAGMAYLETRQFDRALAADRRAIDLQPRDAAGYYLLGCIREDQNRYREAAAAFARAARLDPKDGNYLVCLGYAYYKTKRFREAVDAYERAVRIDADDETGLYNLATAYFHAGRYDAAIDAFERAARANPYIAAPYLGMGYIYAKLDRPRDSLRAYNQAKRIEPDNVETYLELGEAYSRMRRYPEAVAYLRVAVKKDPRSAEAHRWLGFAYRDQRLYQDSLAEFRKAIRLDPEAAWSYAGMASTCGEARRYDDELRYARKAVEVDPKDSYARYSLGMAYADLKQEAEARKQYEALRSSDEGYASRLLEQIEKIK